MMTINEVEKLLHGRKFQNWDIELCTKFQFHGICVCGDSKEKLGSTDYSI